MKQILFLMMLPLVISSINVSAQTKKPVRKAATQKKEKANPIPKDSREYQVGKDGFEWYKVCKNGKYGAEDRNGNLLIPNEYNEIEYYDWLTNIPGYFFVKTNKQGMGTGVYSRGGECIIPIIRNYHFVLLCDWKVKQVGAYFQYCVNSEKGNTGICNIKGEKVFEANCHYDDMQPYYKNGKFFYKVGICDENGWKHGIIDGNGSIVVPMKYKDIEMWGTEFFYDRENDNAVIGKYSSIVTTKNILADNIKLTASASSFNSSSSSVASSSSTASSSSSSSSNNSGNKTTTVVVQHHRDPIPVQEWVQCTACWGSGTCPDCAGSGTKYIGDNLRRCWRCGGRGKCSSCSGQGGRYYTVYK